MSQNEEEKLMQSPKKSSGEYKKALIELKSYCKLLIMDSRVNTGREINDIRRAVEEYLHP